MITTTLRIRPLFCGLTLALAPALSWAGVIQIEPAEGNVPALLLRDAMAYTDAMHSAMLDMDRGILAPGRGQSLKLTRNKVRGATLARVEYTYDEHGQPTTRVYHARSGHSLGNTIRTAGKKHGGASGSETSNGESSAPGSGDSMTGDSPEEIAADAAEATYYPADTAVDVRAPKLPPEDSILEAVEIKPGEGLIHAWDAEIKALRKIEADIHAGVVPRGGTVTGYVSKAVCASCENAIETFAKAFDANGTVYQLIEPGKREVRDARVRRSMNASKTFSDIRKGYADKQLSTNNLKRPGIDDWSESVSTERLEAEEASTLLEDADVCGAS